jgi:DNA-binding winged helix-turn-helix (wHTH) protein
MNRVNHHSNTHAIIAFDNIVVDADRHTLHCNHVLCDLEPKAFSVLQYLLAYPGEVVTKDELLDAIWTHRCVTPNVLARVITQIRRALGDSAHQSRYIETVPTIGYRFIAEVKCSVVQNGGTADQELIFKNDMAHSSELLEELKLLLTRMDGEQQDYPALTRHLSTLVNLFGDKPSGMVLYELALQYGMEKLNDLDLELPWRHGERRKID